MTTSAALAANTEQQRRLKPRGKPWVAGQSGNPAGLRRIKDRIAEVYATLSADLGGDGALSAIERALLMQAVNLLVRAERCKDGSVAVRLTSEARRTLQSLQAKHQSEPVRGTGVAEYIARHHKAPAANTAPAAAPSPARAIEDDDEASDDA